MRLFSSRKILVIAGLQLIQMAAGLIYIKLLASNLPPAQYGAYTLYLTAASLFGMLPITALDQAIYREAAKPYARVKLERLIRCYYSLVAFVTLAETPLFIILLKLNSSFSLAEVCAIAVPFAILSTLKNSLIGLINYRHFKTHSFALKAVENTLKIALILPLIPLIHRFDNGGSVATLTQTVICILLILYIVRHARFGIVFKRRIRLRQVQAIYRRTIVYAKPLITWAVFGYLQNNIYYWVMERHGERVELGIFSMMHNLSFVFPSIFIGLITTYATPRFFHNGISRQTDRELFWLKIFAFIMLGCYTLFVTIFAHPLIALIGHPAYLPYAHLLAYMSTVMAIYHFSMLSTFRFYIAEKPSRLLLANILPGAASLPASYLLDRYHALDGIVVAYAAVYCLNALLVMAAEAYYFRRGQPHAA
ncbi:lipopolysaccharide biosynthesis protein [Paludibacterium yongneupense]|uniref:lipopolysaccharide biosynthesis protein n=1 Tax=Paludibacterium yongneupense TaxID=400061 RepID=UPI00040BA26E|nr:oligosaccharide flippase family protein [Paludibacterium yongneupense]